MFYSEALFEKNASLKTPSVRLSVHLKRQLSTTVDNL
jgi:hypothetical protein